MLVALDIETEGLNNFKDKIICIGIYSHSEQRAFDTLEEFATWLHANPDARFIGHNFMFDVNFLRRSLIDIRSYWAYDTRSIASLVMPRPESLSLENLCLQFGIIKEKYKLDRVNIHEKYSKEEIKKYCVEDCGNTFNLFKALLKQLTAQDKTGRPWEFVESWLMPATKLVAEYEFEGIGIDSTHARALLSTWVTKEQETEKKLVKATVEGTKKWELDRVQEIMQKYADMAAKKAVGITDADKKAKIKRRYDELFRKALERRPRFNFSSPAQLLWLLREFYGLDCKRNRDDKDSTGVEVLTQLADSGSDVAKVLLDYREATKMITTCIPAILDNVKEDGRLHPRFDVSGTRTGRLSSSGPNFQQIPRGDLRKSIIASPGFDLVSIDYAQIEVRVMAELSNETDLIQAFQEGIDPYSVLVKKMFDFLPEIKACNVLDIKKNFPAHRDCGKTAGLSILYGTGAAKLQETILKYLGLKLTEKECRRIINNYRDSLPNLRDYKNDLEKALANRKIAYNLLGRPVMIEDNSDLYMQAMNTMVQGSASDMVVFSQFKLVKPKLLELGIAYNGRALIHDEVLIELPEDESSRIMEEVIEPLMTTGVQKALGFSVPLKVEYKIGKCWEK